MKSSQYVVLFVDEAGMLLEQCHTCLEKLELNPHQPELYRELFRLIHTLKGMAASLIELPYFEEITHLSHCIETLLGECQEPISIEALEILTDSLQMLGILHQNITHPAQNHISQTQLQALYQRFSLPPTPQVSAPYSPSSSAAQTLLLSPEQSEKLAHFREAGKQIFEVQVQLMQACLMKSVRALLVLHNLEQQADVIGTLPELELLREGLFGKGFEVLVATELSALEIQSVAESVSEIEAVQVQPYSPAELQSETKTETNTEELNEFELRILAEAAKQDLYAIWVKVGVIQKIPLLSARITLLFRILETQGEIIKTRPGVQELESGKFDQFFDLLVVTPVAAQTLQSLLQAEFELQSCLQITTSQHGADAEPSPPPVTRLKMLSASETEIYISTAHGEARSSVSVSSEQNVLLAASERLKNIRMQHLVRVDAEQLKELNQLTGELLLARAKLNQVQHAELSLRQGLEELNRIIASLQSVSMQLQTITASQVFNRYPRMVRDLARSLGKEISCTLQGEQVEIDRYYVDDLSSILLHMVRNAADHGLESPADRQRLGKPAKGNIQLSANYQDHQIAIAVQDDGRGIDVQAIKAKAQEQALLSASEAAQLSDEEALKLIFSPGLSTSHATTDISGRGVGMDVVLTHVRQLGGQLEVQSELGQGTCFKITLPSELKHVQAVLVRAEQQYFALPLEQIQRICHASEAQAHLDSDLFSLHSLSRVQNNNGHLPSPAVLLEVLDEEQSLWLMADELIGYQYLAVKALHPVDQRELVQGAALLDPSRLALYLEPKQLLNPA